MKILRVSKEKDGFKLRFGSFAESKALPFQMMITTVRIRNPENLPQALKDGAEVARKIFERMQKFNASDSQIVRGANASSSSWAI